MRWDADGRMARVAAWQGAGLMVRGRGGPPPTPFSLLLFFLLSIFGFAPTVAAADAPEQESATLAERLMRTETVSRLLAETRQDLDNGEGLQALAPELDAAERKLALSLGDLAETRLADAEVMQLYDLQTRVETEGARVAAWAESLSLHANRLEADLEALTREMDDWRRFRTLAREREAPESLARRADAVMESLERQRGQVLTLRNSLLVMLEQAARLRSRVVDLRWELQRRRELIHGQMRSTASEPLWRAEWAPEAGRRHFEQALDVLKLDLVGSATYVREHWPSLLSLFAIPWLGLLFLPKRWLEQAAQRYRDPPDLWSVPALWRAPGVAGLLIGLISLDWLGPPGPVAWYDLLWLAMLGPAHHLARLTWGAGTPRSLSMLYLCLVPVALRTQLELLPWVDRWVLAAQSLVMLAALMRDHAAGRWRRFWPAIQPPTRGWVLGLTAALLGGSLIANVFGRVGLGKNLMQSILGATGFALIYYLAARVLLGAGLALLESPALGGFRIVRHRAETVARALRWGLNLLFMALWILTALLIFRVYDSVWAAGLRLVNHQFTLVHTPISVRAVLTALLLLLGGYGLTRAVKLLLETELFPRWQLPVGLPFAVSALTRYTIGLVAVLLAVRELGIDLTRLGLLAGALGVGIGFGLQNIFNNFVSGLILLLEQPVNVGDVIQVDKVDGVVKRIGIRSSTVRTLQGAEIILPNAELIARDVINWTLSDRRRRLEIEIGVDYRSEPDRVIALLEGLARAAPAVLDNPEPFAILEKFGESALEFRLYVWIEHYEDNLQIGSDLRRAILNALRTAGIGIPYPQRDVHIRRGDAEPGGGGQPMFRVSQASATSTQESAVGHSMR
ncbi:MAG: mechanosensitive ion channel domain-containing protein [Methylococcus sp.]